MLLITSWYLTGMQRSSFPTNINIYLIVSQKMRDSKRYIYFFNGRFFYREVGTLQYMLGRFWLCLNPYIFIVGSIQNHPNLRVNKELLSKFYIFLLYNILFWLHKQWYTWQKVYCSCLIFDCEWCTSSAET